MCTSCVEIPLAWTTPTLTLSETPESPENEAALWHIYLDHTIAVKMRIVVEFG